jgi:glycosyltransferase involved in cell wall biosynthesis
LNPELKKILKLRKSKIVYVISGIDKALAFEWINDSLRSAGFDLSFVIIGKPGSKLSEHLMSNGTEVLQIQYNSNRDFLRATLKTINFLRKKRPDVVHTHLFIANIIGLLSAFLCGIKKRVYTRHHAILHHREAPAGLKWDKICNRLATDIIAISKNVREILINWDRADQTKVRIIPHGFKLEYFENPSHEKVIALRSRYNITKNNFPVIGVIARYTHWKGIQYIIPAFANIRMNYPNARLILANASGDYKTELQRLLSELPSESFKEINFEQDLSSLYQVFDVYVHVPIDEYSEAFGQTYVEALAAGIPSVFTKSGIACDFVDNERNALVVDFKDSRGIEDAITLLLQNKPLRERIVNNGRKSVKEQFQLEKMMSQLIQLYTCRK